MKSAIPVLAIVTIIAATAHAQTASSVPDLSGGPLRLTGSLEARVELRVQPRVAGRLVKVNIREGVSFKAGEVLVEIDPADYEISLAEAQAAVDAAESRLAAMEAGGRAQERDRAAADLASALAVQKNARQNLEIVEGLHASGGVSKQSVDAAKRELEVAQARVVSAERTLSLVRQGPRMEDRKACKAEVDRARALLKLANLRLEETKVKAPFDGTVLQKLVVEGMNVSAASQQGTAICVFGEISTLKAIVDLPEADLPRVRMGQQSRVFVRAYPDRPFAGRVTNVYPWVDARSRNGKVEIEVANAAALLVPGMFAKVELDASSAVAAIRAKTDKGRM